MKKLILLMICAAVFFSSCGKKGDTAPDIKTPQKPVLELPVQNSVCVSGTGQSGSQSTIIFKWDAVPYVNLYDLNIKNLQTGTTLSKTVTVTETSVDLPVNTPYSWQVVTRANGASGGIESDSWKFYSSGPGVVNHAPFPVTDPQPFDGESVQPVNNRVSLSWKGADADNDIADYDVYLGTTAASQQLLQSHTSGASVSNVQVASGTLYYWKIVTRDKQNNISTSDVFQFRVK